MKSPWNTRPYAPKPRSGRQKRHDLVLYTALFAGPVAATVMAAAIAATLR